MSDRAAPPDRALVVTFGGFSHINRSLLSALAAERPDVAFEELDLAPGMRRPGVLARCIAGTVAEYGAGSLLSRERLRYRLLHSRAFHDAARRAIADRMRGRAYRFTLQTQSLFNAATGAVPNFVYTDHVAEARRTGGWSGGHGRPSPGWSALERRIYHDAAHVFTFGSRIGRLLVEAYGLPRGRATAVGAGATVLPARAPETGRDRYARRRILFVGVEWERKGGPDLVAAFRTVREALPDATLAIVGCRPEIDVEGVEVLGRLPPGELEALYRSASCFCMPSRLEPYGVVFAEALHFALPVVACDVGDVADIVDDGRTGRLVPPGDPAALATALVALLRDPDACRAAGREARARAGAFTWEAVARRIARHLPPPRAGDGRGTLRAVGA